MLGGSKADGGCRGVLADDAGVGRWGRSGRWVRVGWMGSMDGGAWVA